ncbi:MAG: aminotransferase class IV [Clostridia bacterium]|nr:aminotransferase class IV [Clostridia bacterium]
MKTLGYYNGEIGELEELRVPMLDRACYFGDGVYDVAYSRNHKAYALREHIDRFYQSMALLNIRLDMHPDDLENLICELIKKVDADEQWVYFQASRGTGLRNHAVTAPMNANLWIMLKPCSIRETYKKINLISLEDKRFLYCNAKTLNLIPAVLYSTEAENGGYDEAVLHRNGRVTGCAHSNISTLKNGVLQTAPADEYILAGIGRAHLIRKCKSFGIPVKEEPFSLDEMMEADEIIVTSAGSLCIAAGTVDGKAVGGKAPELLKRLQDSLMEDYFRATEKD